MMSLGLFMAILIVSIVLCGVGGELVKRYYPDINRSYIHLLHLAYGVVLVFLVFTL
ncbi:MAG: hypothetical protein ACFE7R_11150 [Candidatus Hodarchaeota archaeon]